MDLHKAGMGFKTIGKQLGEKVTTAGQSPSVWSSTQDLTSWSKTSPEQLGISWDHSHHGNTLHREGLRSKAGKHVVVR